MPIVVVLTGEAKANAVEVVGLTGSNLVARNQPISLNFELKNKGMSPVKSVTYEYSINGEATVTNTVECPTEIPMGGSAIVPMSFVPVDAIGEYDMHLEITKVNGEDNQAANTSVDATFDSKAFLPVNRPVMEEMTATWCGWCTRGWMAMKEMKKLYPGQFIGMAYHANDILAINGAEFPFSVGGYPSCRIDRYTRQVKDEEGNLVDDDPDPYFGYNMHDLGIKAVYDEAAARFGYASINLDTKWNADSTELSVATEVKFAELAEGASYKIGYVVLQNGICHPDNGEFAQQNFYAGDTDRAVGGLAPLGDLPAKISDFVFDDVVINMTDCRGVAGSVPNNVEEEVPFTHNYTVKTADCLSVLGDGKEMIQNPAKMEVVALLIDQDNHVVNARLVAAGSATSEEVGIADTAMDQENAPVVYYNIMGQRVANPANGLYIRLEGNKASKVIL